MTQSRTRPALGVAAYFTLAFVLGMYFTFASVQGDYGLFRRIQIEAEITELEDELAVLEEDVDRLSNKTRRLSDRYLDLDLLDEQAREVLGMVRADEIVLR
ncbi:septum formation initiator family protein [Mesobaculum littorinae]|uniref:Septum formation initiator family protein n=1 Tax=Mesobaculum littorinae TaxID=2486419 RepID=A0A438AJW8_9RHOB|nr:septum formation initiator family protein [Mesobaculum littorinae]RVV99010.1 septum formation initiator family protein [Mesobaculum littorinae]